jgi:hypothetical protein
MLLTVCIKRDDTVRTERSALFTWLFYHIFWGLSIGFEKIFYYLCVGAPAGAGALRRGGSLFEKSSAKTFLFGGTANLCAILHGESEILRRLRARRSNESKLLFEWRDLGLVVLFAREKNCKMTWTALERKLGRAAFEVLD